MSSPEPLAPAVRALDSESRGNVSAAFFAAHTGEPGMQRFLLDGIGGPVRGTGGTEQ